MYETRRDYIWSQTQDDENNISGATAGVLRCDSFVFPASRVLSQPSFAVAPSDEFDDNPDLSGVYVDGFPLPATPIRTDDAQLQSALRQVPITTPLDQPLDSKRDLTTSSQPTSDHSGRGVRWLSLGIHTYS